MKILFIHTKNQHKKSICNVDNRTKYMVMQSVKLATHPCQCFAEATSAVASLPAAKQGTEL